MNATTLRARQTPARGLRRLDLYIIGEVFPMFLAGLAVIVLLLVLGFLFEVAAPLIAKGANPLLIAKYLAFRLPEAFSRGAPLALLFAVLLSLSRLSQDSEIKAAIVHGIPPTRLTIPVLLLGCIVSVFAFIVQESFVPRGYDRAQGTLKDIILANPRVLVNEGQFFKDGQGQAIYVEHVLERGQLQGVSIIQTSPGQIPRSLTTAPRGEILADQGAIRLFNGQRLTYRIGDNAKPITVARFREALIPIRDLQQGADVNKNPIFLSIPTLIERIRNYEQMGQTASPEQTALNRKFAEPIASIAFALFGVAVALFTLRSNASLGFVGVMFLTFFYYATWSVFRVMGEQGALPPIIAGWAPDAIYAGAGLVLLLLARRK